MIWLMPTQSMNKLISELLTVDTLSIKIKVPFRDVEAFYKTFKIGVFLWTFDRIITLYRAIYKLRDRCIYSVRGIVCSSHTPMLSFG